MGRKNKRCCSIPDCRTYSSPGVSFHVFPLNNDVICKKWQIATKVGRRIIKSTSICSKHFVKQDFLPFTEQTRRRRLKKNAIPSRNLPCEKYNGICYEKLKMKRYLMKWDEINDVKITVDEKDPLAMDDEEQFENSDLDLDTGECKPTTEEIKVETLLIDEIKVEIKKELTDT